MRQIILLVSLLTLPLTCLANEAPPREEDRKVLRQILADFETGLNEKKLDMLYTHLDDQAVMTFMTTEVTVGKDALKSYYEKMFKGDDAPLSDHITSAKLDGKAIFHGDTVVASGRTNDVFTLKDGPIYGFNTRWVATVVKKQGAWKVVSVNFSVDPFDNVVISELQNKIWINAIIAFIVGIVAAFAIGRFKKGQ